MDDYLRHLFINEAKVALDRRTDGSVIEVVPETLILVDEEGNEFAAVASDKEIELTATVDDIREGCTAVTKNGVETGEKFIPSYVVRAGYQVIMAGSTFAISISKMNGYDFTSLQAIICPYAGSISSSVAAEKVSIEGYVYNVNSVDAIATVEKDSQNKRINLAITNDSGTPYILRYFTYKEVY